MQIIIKKWKLRQSAIAKQFKSLNFFKSNFFKQSINEVYREFAIYYNDELIPYYRNYNIHCYLRSQIEASGIEYRSLIERRGGLFVFLHRNPFLVGFLVGNEIPDFNTKAHALAIAADGIRTSEIEIAEAV